MIKVRDEQRTEAPPERDWYRESATTGGPMERYSKPLPAAEETEPKRAPEEVTDKKVAEKKPRAKKPATRASKKRGA